MKTTLAQSSRKTHQNFAALVRASAAVPKMDIKEDYVQVRKEDSKQQGAQQPAQLGVSLGLREYAKTMFGKNPYKVQITYDHGTATSGAGAALATVYNCDPVLATEFASFAALFDEARLIATHADWFLTSTGSISTVLPLAILVHDPATATALASVAAAYAHTKRAGPISPSLAGGSAQSAPLQVTNHGCVKLSSGMLMKGAVTQNGSGTLQVFPIQGDWFPTNSTAAITSFFKIYVEALGGTATSSSRLIQTFELEFRARQ